MPNVYVCPYCFMESLSYHESPEDCKRAAGMASMFQLRLAHREAVKALRESRETVERLTGTVAAMRAERG